jgi:soluble lytic murein transglycosylase-like protein
MVAVLALVVLAIGHIAMADASYAYGNSKHRAPSQSQLDRLKSYEHLIHYFSSLDFGPDSAPMSPNYLRALILGESSGVRHATSHKGARGLTQIMPQTGREAVGELLALNRDFYLVDRERLEKFEPSDLYDPAVNLLIAAYLTSTYHHRYNGSSTLVTAAWNAGPHAVTRNGNRTPHYRETHQLIERVNGYVRFFETERYATTSIDRWNTSGWNAPGWNRAFDSPF